MFFRSIVDLSAYVAIRVLVAMIQAMSLKSCERVAKALAVLAYDVVRVRRTVIDENVRHAFPQLSRQQQQEIGRGMWSHLVLMVAEIAHAPRKIHRNNWRRHCTIPEMRQIVQFLIADRPKVVLSGHFGNFELAGFMLGLFGFPSHSIARKLDNPYLDRFVNEFRGLTGQQMLDKEGSGAAVAEVLAGGGTIALLGDQYAGPKGCWVQFLGRPASSHKAVAVLPLGAKAPVMVSCARRLGNPLQYELAFAGVADPAVPDFQYGDVQSLSQWYVSRLEHMIRNSPQQYWWVHRRWKGTPPPAALRKLQAA